MPDNPAGRRQPGEPSEEWGGHVEEDRLEIPMEQVTVGLTKDGIQLEALQKGGAPSGFVAACGAEVGVLAVGALIAYHDTMVSLVEMPLGSTVVVLLFLLSRQPQTRRGTPKGRAKASLSRPGS